MPYTDEHPLIQTIPEKCRMCYACVRECPAKAIQVVDGQAKVIQVRCIGCGNCVRMCSQNAKQIRDETDKVFALLGSGEKVAAIVAPSFPAEFTEEEPGTLVAMLRALGFTLVHEVSFGADLVAHAYRKLMESRPDSRFITTPCPSAVSYVRKYYPDLMRYLAPIVSPMVASARALRLQEGQDLRVVFIGPCIAKKGESSQDKPDGEIDAVLTFAELRAMFDRCELSPSGFSDGDDFDPPRGAMGAVFPMSGGQYAKHRVTSFDFAHWGREIKRFADLDLTTTFEPAEQTITAAPTAEELQDILRSMGKESAADCLDCGACGYDTCDDHARAVFAGLADADMCLPFTVEKLRTAYADLEESHRSLDSTKEVLVKSERLASMGQLAAGIAHEVNNPLGILLLQANILLEECENDSELRGDLVTIVDQANRCKRIISGLLNFARQSHVVRQPARVPDLVYNVLRTMPIHEDVHLAVKNEMDDPVANIDSDQIVQVLVNLISNAQGAMREGGEIQVRLSDSADEVVIQIWDNGVGIPGEIMEKLFEPFFTTKQVGLGTGLGLAVAHGIVKMHNGQINVESNADPSAGPTETTFTITLPRNAA